MEAEDNTPRSVGVLRSRSQRLVDPVVFQPLGELVPLESAEDSCGHSGKVFGFGSFWETSQAELVPPASVFHFFHM